MDFATEVSNLFLKYFVTKEISLSENIVDPFLSHTYPFAFENEALLDFLFNFYFLVLYCVFHTMKHMEF